jgi:hypothetical protein
MGDIGSVDQLIKSLLVGGLWTSANASRNLKIGLAPPILSTKIRGSLPAWLSTWVSNTRSAKRLRKVLSHATVPKNRYRSVARRAAFLRGTATLRTGASTRQTQGPPAAATPTSATSPSAVCTLP